jgi:Flp pilus assembly protein TadG
MATAEFAVALPAVILVLVLALAAISTVSDQVRCIDAARATARLLARGDATGSALAQGRRLAPDGATFSVGGSGSEVTVRVVSRSRPGMDWLGAVAVPSGHAVAAREDVAP